MNKFRLFSPSYRSGNRATKTETQAVILFYRLCIRTWKCATH